jgi:hypothetical protein
VNKNIKAIVIHFTIYIMEQGVLSISEFPQCPDCKDLLMHEDGEFLGNGIMSRSVYCTSCDWEAIEEWVHHRTVETQMYD